MLKQSKKELIQIATLGKVVGLKGDLKLHINSDFPEQFVAGRSFIVNEKETITLSDVNHQRGLVKIQGYENPDDVRRFTNAKLYTTIEDTRKNCHLEEGEHFWFDIEGCSVYENGKALGVVSELDRILDNNYLNIKTDEALVESGFAKSFLLPYNNMFIIDKDVENKKITATGAMDILEAS
ncbi:MAG: 16S rRNA processing protein RimM [Campylobacterales bacterium]|nr:16S rRNA processing protein RimM [Campylobacterales bacterium]